ncbi:tRNA (5-methylaminomethyl-2-thiouridine)(34)-methyltransferase MnmD [Parapedobacter sp. ISTM3]|uniref:tRNA U34 5-methylaminomethyl-2-thiouridine-forming methyltransferase MnmC n=1 Tax=Parapedobacter luteus TaxID=623280 RepID=A0A1T4ZUB5_9SPHI|nr:MULTISPECIES: tRNA (5-methylaminomethyl-2-thiouridine)(34)-methyltransferase MnmD [Parapedobacter]MBK1438654.1 tRNA (5-methylaminomethyl-2-thiouridine)(34)-methyltransferase MnmD [Parapedobacter sp. ISTM3]SKB26330.1 tRNA U34 5-methylaminomethyl-2-thiouridine-forming methyltransferase MnmC [Parapedobacter luteus]
MKEFVVTADGSKTLYHPDIGEHYHSRHGAVQESRHVFLGMGLQHFLASPAIRRASVLEIGFGTGLNFLLSADYCIQHAVTLDYTGVEAYPLPIEIISQTGYDAYVGREVWHSFLSSYSNSQRQAQTFAAGSSLEVMTTDVLQFVTSKRFDVLYFDAFAAVHQPEMWSAETLKHVCGYLKPGGIFVTYAITGHLKRAMSALGFAIEKVPGAPGKREMLRATKNS